VLGDKQIYLGEEAVAPGGRISTIRLQGRRREAGTMARAEGDQFSNPENQSLKQTCMPVPKLGPAMLPNGNLQIGN
jgi:hypothetical protein